MWVIRALGFFEPLEFVTDLPLSQLGTLRGSINLACPSWDVGGGIADFSEFDIYSSDADGYVRVKEYLEHTIDSDEVEGAIPRARELFPEVSTEVFDLAADKFIINVRVFGY